MSPVITPTGISAGKKTVLASVSAHKRNAAPAKNEAGIMDRISGPIKNLVICGIMRPTNPITPLKATDMAVKTPAKIKYITFMN